MHIPKPFKNPAYTKNATRRTQTLKTLLSREKERDKAVRAERSQKLKGNVEGGDVPVEGNNTVGGVGGVGNGNDEEMQEGSGSKSKLEEDPETMDIDMGEIDVALRKDELELIEEEGINPDDIPSCKHVKGGCRN